MTGAPIHTKVNNSLLYTDIIDNGLDRQNIATLNKRFMAVNDDRLERMRGALSDRHQLFMDALPLLFHCNHPMMPGYISHQTPARISHYKPSKRDVLVGKMLAKSFTIQYDPSSEDDIFGLYIMGSVGTIAQSERSDLDIWVCHRPGLKGKLKAELERKCEKISAWAMQMRLEVHFFLMDHEAAKEKKFSKLNEESSGSAQQQLLLDEFYRSAIYIAGRTPIWWYVPAQDEHTFHQYTNTLLYQRFIPNDSVLDFGGMAEIPPGEFLGAGVWQLYKAIESPYKSMLKLLLLEAYVADYPDIEPLSLTFKQLIYAGETSINALDSYVMVYHRIEEYLLERDQHERLELARRCFYFKVNKALSHKAQRASKSWQRLLMEKLTETWGWTPELIQFLDGRSQWKAADVTAEHQKLVKELNHSYQLLLAFANRTGKKNRRISTDELIVLGRKLQAAFERRPGKIDWVNPGISKDLSESVLRIHRVSAKNAAENIWTAFSHEAGGAIADSGKLVKSANTPIELILWCHINGIITRDTRVELEDESVLSALEIRRLLNEFNEWLPLPLDAPAHANFQRSASPEAVLFLINAGQAPEPELHSQGYQRMSDRSDALSYGGFEENLVASVDVAVKNTWGEVTIRRFENANALLDAVGDYLQLTLPGTHQRPPQVRVSCIGNAHASTITNRVQDWLGEITRCFFTGRGAQYKRFIFQMADSYHCLQYANMKPQITSFRTEALLIHHLEKEQPHYSQLVIDSHALRGHPLRIIALNARPNAINVFFRKFDIGVEIYVIDERGSVLHTLFRGRRKYNPLKPLYLLLRAVLYRQAQVNQDLSGDFGIFPIHYFEILKNGQGQYITQSRKIVPDNHELAKIEVKASAHYGPDREICYDYYCDQQEFSHHSFNSQLEIVVSQYILSRRAHTEHYPVYITDLDLSQVSDSISPNGDLQVVHYLRIKHRLEAALNRAIGILLDA